MMYIIILFAITATIIIAILLITQVFFYKVTVKNLSDKTRYTDNKFGYELEFPSTWSYKRFPFVPGFVEIYPENNKFTKLYVWYKDSEQINSEEELITFVKSDSEYASVNQNLTITNVFPHQVGKFRGVAMDYVDLEGVQGRLFYIADITPTDDQQIFVWIIGVLKSDSNPNLEYDDGSISNILDSFKLLE